jgi:flagella basal body P-ring formation protein FlgA
MMTIRAIFLSAALLAVSAAQTGAQGGEDTVAVPLLRANVAVTSDVVRIGDVVDNAGSVARIAIYRAPDLGATGSLPTAQVLSALRAHQVIAVETGNIQEVTVTRLARTVQTKEIELAVARALEHRGGLGDAANITLTFNRELQDLHLDASNTGPIVATSAHYEPRGGRFDVTLEIANDNGTPTKLRFAGTAIETVEAAVLTRNVERAELLKSSDIVAERRPKSEVGNDPASRDSALGMQMRRPMRAGQPLRAVDLAKPDLVQRDQAVTVIYQAAGMYLTTRGKALDGGTEGDVVSVLNPQSKRTVTGVITGRGQVTIQVATPQPVYIADTGAAPTPDQPAAPAPPITAVSSQASKQE